MSTVSDIACHVLLETLQRRNGAVELAGMTFGANDSAVRWYRARVLEYGPSGLIVERPHAVEAVRVIHPDAYIRVLAVDGNDRWLFLSRVRRDLRYNLNADTRVAAIDISPPMDVQSGQRREFFRVLTVSGGLRPVLLTPAPVQPVSASAEAAAPPSGPLKWNAGAGPAATPPAQGTAPAKSDAGAAAPAAQSGAAPAPPVTALPPVTNATGVDFPPQPFHAPLLNISGGGIGVEAPQRVTRQVRKVWFYRCRLELPTLSGPLEVSARVRHIKPMEGGTHYLGLAFEFLNPADKRVCVDAACRFAAWYQRQQLQRLSDRD